ARTPIPARSPAGAAEETRCRARSLSRTGDWSIFRRADTPFETDMAPENGPVPVRHARRRITTRGTGPFSPSRVLRARHAASGENRPVPGSDVDSQPGTCLFSGGLTLHSKPTRLRKMDLSPS